MAVDQDFQDAASTRAAIVSAAVELLRTAGESGVKMALVAERSGYSVGAIYHHFSGRTQLLAVARVALAFDSRKIESVTTPGGSFDVNDTLDAHIERSIALLVDARTNPNRITGRWNELQALALTRDLPELAETVRDLRAGFVATFVHSVELADHHGWFDPRIDKVAFARMIGQIVFGNVIYDHENRVEVTSEHWRSVFAPLVLMTVPEDLRAHYDHLGRPLSETREPDGARRSSSVGR